MAKVEKMNERTYKIDAVNVFDLLHYLQLVLEFLDIDFLVAGGRSQEPLPCITCPARLTFDLVHCSKISLAELSYYVEWERFMMAKVGVLPYRSTPFEIESFR